MPLYYLLTLLRIHVIMPSLHKENKVNA